MPWKCEGNGSYASQWDGDANLVPQVAEEYGSSLFSHPRSWEAQHDFLSHRVRRDFGSFEPLHYCVIDDVGTSDTFGRLSVQIHRDVFLIKPVPSNSSLINYRLCFIDSGVPISDLAICMES